MEHDSPRKRHSHTHHRHHHHHHQHHEHEHGAHCDHAHDHAHAHDHEDHKHGHECGHSHEHDHSHSHSHGKGAHAGCGHDHGEGVWAYLPHAHGLHERIQADRRSLLISCVILFVSLCVQIGGGLLVDSSVLEAEAVHTALDGLVLVVSLISIALASKPRTSRYTYGYGRAEVLSALVSVLTLVLMCVQLAGGAVRRLFSPHAVNEHKGQAVMVAEALTLVNNVLIAFVLARNNSLNIRALRAHVVGDSVGNVVVLLAGAVMWARPSYGILDPLLTLVVVTAICVLNIPLARETIGVLMQAAPSGLDDDVLRRHLEAVVRVRRVVDAHAWTVTTGAIIASAKLEVDELADFEVVQREAEKALARIGISDATIQVNRWAGDADDVDIEQGAVVVPHSGASRVVDDARYGLLGDSDDNV